MLKFHPIMNCSYDTNSRGMAASLLEVLLLPLYGFMLYSCFEGFLLEVGKMHVQDFHLETLLSQSALMSTIKSYVCLYQFHYTYAWAIFGVFFALSFNIFIDELLVINTGTSATGGRENERLWNFFLYVKISSVEFYAGVSSSKYDTPSLSGMLYIINFILQKPLIYKTAVCWITCNGMLYCCLEKDKECLTLRMWLWLCCLETTNATEYVCWTRWDMSCIFSM